MGTSQGRDGLALMSAERGLLVAGTSF